MKSAISALPPRPLAPLRTRPTERPQWIEAPVGGPVLDQWRRAARDAVTPVDVWVSLLLERQLVESELGPLYGDVLAEAAAVAAQPRLVPTIWRRWIAQLAGGALTGDELPSVVIPARLVARVAPSTCASTFAALDPADFAAARTLEMAAVADGLTMEAWAYRCAIQSATR
jgi:hypothetical protein